MPATRSGAGLGLVLVAYTVITLVAMAQFGRETWRRNGEVFSVWFGIVGRLAPLAWSARSRGRRRGPTAEGVRGGCGSDVRARPARARRRAGGLVLAALSTGGILFDGLSQTQTYFDWFGIPTILEQTCCCSPGSALVVGLRPGRRPDRRDPAAPCRADPDHDRLPDRPLPHVRPVRQPADRPPRQRPVRARLGPARRRRVRAADGLAAGRGGLEPPARGGGRRPRGRRLGRATPCRPARRRRVRTDAVGADEARAVRRRQVPLALLMVGLTALTLWSLGQTIVARRRTADPSAGRAGRERESAADGGSG